MNRIKENRENIEWFNYWIEEANKNKQRILLIGDSVARQYRKSLNNILIEEGYVVDIMAMSFYMCDKLMEEEIVKFVNHSEYQYEYILFHLGAHHGYWLNCRDNIFHKEFFKNGVKRILKIVSEKCSNILIISGTPERGKTEKERSQNDEIKIRNKILHDIANENEYQYLELYTMILKEHFDYVDSYHFVRSADEYIANRITETILGGKKRVI